MDTLPLLGRAKGREGCAGVAVAECVPLAVEWCVGREGIGGAACSGGELPTTGVFPSAELFLACNPMR